jgi:alanine-glyoxylate transaminase/(R)-3-amino-2-methylpropionate-pyruvate transaminase
MTLTAPQVSAAMPPCAHVPRRYEGPSKAETLALRRQYGHPSNFLYYRDPLMLVEGHMQYLYDETGRRYLDLFAGIVTASCGHCHPELIRRLEAQLSVLQHTTTIYLHPAHGELARRIAETLPQGLEVTYFVNSGSEANDLAVLMARLYTGNDDVIAVRNGYHGGSPSTMGLTSLSTWKYPVQESARVHHAVCPDPYRSPFSGTPEEIASRSAADIRDLIRFSTPGMIAAFIAEPIQGVGGVTLGAPNYLREAYAVVRAHGGLCIADEVQTGFGRTGEHFWGFECSGVVPDIVTVAKAMGNGYPMGAVITRREIAEAMSGRLHFNTFGGNPMAMTAGLAVLDIIVADGLQRNARIVGGRLEAGMRELMTRHPLIGDVRGRGLLLGMELVRDRVTKEPATVETTEVWELAREMGVLIGKGGIDGNVLRIKPPLCITAADVDFALDVLDRALGRSAPR